MTHSPPWGTLDLAPGDSTELTIGTLRIVVRRQDTEIRLRVGRDVDWDEEADADWERWAVPEDARLHLRPAAPDRLLVVSHEYPFHLPGRRDARVFVRLPVFVQGVVVSAELDDLLVLDAPSVVLSDTWWGTIQEGELAYWLTTKARAEVSDELFVPHMAMCPVRLENESNEALPVDRFAVRALHLSLFRSGSRIWTDEVGVRYLAAAEGSEIEFGGSPPAEAPDAVPVSEPRIGIRRGLQARTFDRLRTFTMLGG
ncbi:MAG: hypothetical protein U5R14_01210 [Gemmatimonadota bacterium]|nr:hypothetical protein [Gemmatimonadota bacterium]